MFSWRGEWYLAHLAARTISVAGLERVCPLGRETALARLTWTDDGWPRLAGGGHHPSLIVLRTGDALAEGVREPPRPFRDDSFTGAVVGVFAVDAARQSRWAAFDSFECVGEER